MNKEKKNHKIINIENDKRAIYRFHRAQKDDKGEKDIMNNFGQYV